MRSICIKTNNIIVIKYLLKELESLKFENVYYSCLKFKQYTNIIIHHKNTDYTACISFLYTISTILSDLVVDIYEKDILKKILHHDYFYFSQDELSTIFNNILVNNNKDSYNKFYIIFDSFYNYLSCNKKIFLDGFITFRLKDYVSELYSIIDKTVNQYLIEKEYKEFISLLKLYISTEPSKSKNLHLIYLNQNSTLLDENLNIIQIDKNIFNAKYLSDISFSSNDFILNMILSLLPHKIYIHLKNNERDEFINTLLLIFENKIEICNSCSICQDFFF